MFLPMGTIVTVCMLLTIVFASRFPWLGLNKVSPLWLLRIIGSIAIAAGLWNALWHGLRHLNQFWGLMALGSGVLLVALGVLLVQATSAQAAWLNRLRPFFVIALLAFFIQYAQTLYHL